MQARRCLPAARAAMLAALDVAAIRRRCMRTAAPRAGRRGRRGATSPRWSTPRPTMSCSPRARRKPQRRCSRRTGDGPWRRSHVAPLCLRGRSSLRAVRRPLCAPTRWLASASTATALCDLTRCSAAWRHDQMKACRWWRSTANNETGVVQPVAAIAALVKAAGGVLVVDAVQAAGRIPLDIQPAAPISSSCRPTRSAVRSASAPSSALPT